VPYKVGTNQLNGTLEKATTAKYTIITKVVIANKKYRAVKIIGLSIIG
jgi:hypothetical protein